jgi:DNA-binding NtrC family response regulator
MTDANSPHSRSWPALVWQVLVFDGDESVAALVRKWLTPFPCSIDSTRDNSEACAMIDSVSRNRRYDVIIADLCQSLESGAALLPLLESKGSRLPIVSTYRLGFDPTPSIAKARHVGLRVFLHKPFRAKQLFNAISQVIDDSLWPQSEFPEPPS